MLPDIILTVLCYFAAFCQILLIRLEWIETQCASFSALLRLAGWFVVCVRFSHVLIRQGELPVSATSMIALSCLALAEVSTVALGKRRCHDIR